MPHGRWNYKADSPKSPITSTWCMFLLICGSATRHTRVLSIPIPANDRTMETFMFFGNCWIASSMFSSMSALAGFRVVNETLEIVPRACAFCNKSNPPITPDGKCRVVLYSFAIIWLRIQWATYYKAWAQCNTECRPYKLPNKIAFYYIKSLWIIWISLTCSTNYRLLLAKSFFFMFM